jgi:AGZA family xanthine/uracil permease-like MFS transporter
MLPWPGRSPLKQQYHNTGATHTMSARYPLFVRRDLDGFFGLAIDNLVQMLLIVGLCGTLCGMSGDNAYFITQRILPGVAVSVLIGNLFYAAQAHWVARREKRSDVTALPYGINTPSLIVYVFFVMVPIYQNTHNPELAWRMGLIACLGSGLIEFFGAFVAERVRRTTPRAALLTTLAGIAITFISMTFALQIWQRPLVAMVPMAIVLLVYFSHIRFPLGLPGGFVAVLLGTGLAWALPLIGVPTDVPMSVTKVHEAWAQHGRYLPQWYGREIWDMLCQNPAQVLPYLSVIIPMGLFNVIGSLQNIESAEAGGDVYATGPSLAVNGIGTLAAAMFGSCFPTTIYIGHPGWKALGARAGYSTLNGLFVTVVCLTGTVPLISKIVPLEAGIAIVVWIGVVITAQAFQTSPLRHAPAAAIGLFPAIAAWGATIVAGAFMEANRNPNDYSLRMAAQRDWPAAVVAPAVSQPAAAEPMRFVAATEQDLLESGHAQLGGNTMVKGFLLHGLNILERGYIFTCMILAAIAAFLIDRRFFRAAAWSAAAAVLTLLGLMHADQLKGNDVDYLLAFTTPAEGAFAYRAYPLVVGYLLMAGVFVAIGYLTRGQDEAASTLQEARVVESDPGCTVLMAPSALAWAPR